MSKITVTGKSLDYEGITGDVEIEAWEALKALEEQAPEVLNPWRKVEDEEPPKDGSRFLWRENAHEPGDRKSYFMLKWDQEENKYRIVMTGLIYSEDAIRTGDWMPIPEVSDEHND